MNFNVELGIIDDKLIKAFNAHAKQTETSAATLNLLNRLLAKFLRGDDDFTRRELRSLPFIIYKPEVTFDGAKNILRQVNFIPSNTAGNSLTLQFVHAALKHFFRANVELPAQIEMLQRLDDPRFGHKRFRWDTVEAKFREIFCRRLCEKDLDVFFKLVAATGKDKQWRYREKFWREYLPRISNTWIFLGKNARIEAAKLSNLNHGSLTGAASANQSVFVFQVGRYIFSEWNNDGKVRAHCDNQQNLFGLGEVNGNFIRDNFVMEWAHSSPQTNFWQRQVRGRIDRNC